MWRRLIHKAGFIILVGAALAAGAQDATTVAAPAAGGLFTPTALDKLLKPIALYPDPLLAQIFAAATLPSEIVLADRYVNQGGDITQADQQPWDPSVQALVHYPTVLKWLDDNLPWTTEVGQAFLNQQQDVMDSVQRLRAEAQSEGNLQSTPQENVVSDAGDVEIEPADPNMIYVPTYAWDSIYTEPGIYCGFGVGFPIGLWLGYDWDWRNHHIIAWGAGHPRPGDWWRRAPSQRITPRGVPVWHPSSRASAAFAHGPDRGFASDAFRPGRVSMPVTPAPSEGFQARPGGVAPRESVPGAISRPVTPLREAPAGGIARPPTEIARPPTEIARPPAEIARPPIEAPRAAPEIRESPGVSAFGGPDNSAAARESSSRGAESRGTFSGGGGSAGGGGRRR